MTFFFLQRVVVMWEPQEVEKSATKKQASVTVTHTWLGERATGNNWAYQWSNETIKFRNENKISIFFFSILRFRKNNLKNNENASGD